MSSNCQLPNCYPVSLLSNEYSELSSLIENFETSFAYDNSRIYKLGEIVIHKNVAYKMIDQIGAAGPDWAPPRKSNWLALIFDKTVVYKVGDIVTGLDLNTYKMIDAIGQAGESFGPPRPTNWSLISTVKPLTDAPIYDNSKIYYLGEHVTGPDKKIYTMTGEAGQPGYAPPNKNLWVSVSDAVTLAPTSAPVATAAPAAPAVAGSTGTTGVPTAKPIGLAKLEVDSASPTPDSELASSSMDASDTSSSTEASNVDDAPKTWIKGISNNIVIGASVGGLFIIIIIIYFLFFSSETPKTE